MYAHKTTNVCVEEYVHGGVYMWSFSLKLIYIFFFLNYTTFLKRYQKGKLNQIKGTTIG